jgi:hypothetical protein
MDVMQDLLFGIKGKKVRMPSDRQSMFSFFRGSSTGEYADLDGK